MSAYPVAPGTGALAAVFDELHVDPPPLRDPPPNLDGAVAALSAKLAEMTEEIARLRTALDAEDRALANSLAALAQEGIE